MLLSNCRVFAVHFRSRFSHSKTVEEYEGKESTHIQHININNDQNRKLVLKTYKEKYHW